MLADCAEQQGVTISYEIEADFILDASGFGRVLPRLLGLEVPSTLPPRRAIFTHIEDHITAAHYADTLMTGVNAFRCYVEGWYTGEFQDVVLHDNPNPKIKQMICSILAGYAWDETNPFVAEPARRLKAVAAICKS